MANISVVVADDHPFVLKGVSDFLKSASGINVIDICSDGARALASIREKKPDVAILSPALPKMSGLDVLIAANREGLSTRIILLSVTAQPRDIITAMAEGAHAFLLKESQPAELLSCIYNVAAGRKRVPFELLERSQEVEKNKHNRVSIEKLLTPREWKIMALAAEGLSNKEIAHRLKVTTGTTKIHLHHIYRKIGVKNRTSLANVVFQYSPATRPDR